MKDVENIMVFSRNTKFCRKVLHYGIEMAKKYGAKLHVLNILHNPFGIEGWYVQLPSLPSLKEEYRKLQEEGKKELEEMIRLESASGLPIEIMVQEGEILDEMFRLIEDRKIDLLVVGAHREGKLEHLMFGHITENLIRRMPCSIVLVKNEPEDIVKTL